MTGENDNLKDLLAIEIKRSQGRKEEAQLLSTNGHFFHSSHFVRLAEERGEQPKDIKKLVK
ncbi:hypothetical protein BGZ80_011462 [Entomortierella chlamydospora]|uniref:Uncharacterized protein n=1 Tax=Entomortierella chlamydospora TaxID=101097 RepID=A0A9P6MU64_9FUNG|nr:hypothetical protein BGZ80_011462 [Entomortierella chlamydospora]